MPAYVYFIGATVVVALFVALLYVTYGQSEDVEPRVKTPADDEMPMSVRNLRPLIAAGFILTAMLLLFFPLYGLNEATRLKAQDQRQNETLVELGAALFAPPDATVNPHGADCARCHGLQGQGGIGLPLNTADFGPKGKKYDPNFLRTTIELGRPPEPQAKAQGVPQTMPAWSDEFGGPLDSQQIDGLVAFIQSQRWDLAEQLAAHAAPTPVAPAAPVSGDPVAAGKQIFQTKCVGCHAISGEVPGGTVGPDLKGFASRPQIAATVPNNPDNVKKWLANPPAVKPGTIMPNLALQPAEIDALIAFLETHK